MSCRAAFINTNVKRSLDEKRENNLSLCFPSISNISEKERIKKKYGKPRKKREGEG